MDDGLDRQLFQGLQLRVLPQAILQQRTFRSSLADLLATALPTIVEVDQDQFEQYRSSLVTPQIGRQEILDARNLAACPLGIEVLIDAFERVADCCCGVYLCHNPRNLSRIP